MDRQNKKVLITSPWLLCFNGESQHDTKQLSKETCSHGKPGGWRSMPYIIGNESFERLASVGLMANFMVFLMTKFDMEQVAATYILNVWSGANNFAPLIGAYVSDTYIGRFRTIAFSSLFSLLGMVTLTMVMWIPKLHPSPCPDKKGCPGPNSHQLGFLILALGLLTVGTGGIRPCSLPFGVDQFDSTTDEGRLGINSFYNWYYTTFTVIIIVALTCVVYIQDSVSWVLGFGIPTICMFFSIALFFLGSSMYVHVKPEGSIFSSIAQVIVSAYRKRGIDMSEGQTNVVFYDPALKGDAVLKLPLTNGYKSLNKAAIIMPGELNPSGMSSNPWRLCSVQHVEELKCILRIVPIWASGIVCVMAMVQQDTFTISQAMKMDLHLGSHFKIPPGSLAIISMITVAVWMPLYDRLIVPSLRKVTGLENGITPLQRIGIGIIFSVLAMVVAGLYEPRRRSISLSGKSPPSVLWLSPQLVLMGFTEVFSLIGQIEFYNRQFPDHLTSVGNALFFLTIGIANYLSSILVMGVRGVTGKNGWLSVDINNGRVEYFYYLLAGMGILNFVYFLVCAKRYRYKEGSVRFTRSDLELV